MPSSSTRPEPATGARSPPWSNGTAGCSRVCAVGRWAGRRSWRMRQEAVLLAMLNLERLRRRDRFGPWLAGIGLNVCRRRLRQRSGGQWALGPLDQVNPAFDPPDQSPSPEEAAVARDTARRVRDAVAGLPEGQRRAVVLFYLAGLTVAEVAEELGVAGGAVRVRLHDGRASLRRRLESLWKEEVMGTEDPGEPVEMRVREVRRRPGVDGDPDGHVAVLEAIEGDRQIRIWIGSFEPPRWRSLWRAKRPSGPGRTALPGHCSLRPERP